MLKDLREKDIQTLEKSASDDTKIWADFSIRKCVNEILMRIAGNQPKEGRASTIFETLMNQNLTEFDKMFQFFSIDQ